MSVSRHLHALQLTALFLTLFMLVWSAANAIVSWIYRDPAAEKYALMFTAGAQAERQLWGTSHVVHGVSPSLFGDDVYNFAFNASTPAFYRAWYADWRRLKGPPKQVYFGLDAFIFKRYTWARSYEQDSGFWPWSRVLERVLRWDREAPTVLLNRFALIRYRDAMQGALVGGRGDTYRMLWDRTCRGFVPLAARAPLAPPGSAQHAKAAAAATPRSLRDATTQPDDPLFVADLTALLDQLQHDGVRVIGFQPPYQRGEAAEFARVNHVLAGLLTARRMPFLNYNAALRSTLNDRPELFVDSTHLNIAGAEIFSGRLAHDLRARRLL